MTPPEAMRLVRASDELSAPGSTRIERRDGMRVHETRSYGNYWFGNLFDLDAEPADEAAFRELVRHHREAFAWRREPAGEAPAPDAPAVLRWCVPLGAPPAPSPYEIGENVALVCDSASTRSLENAGAGEAGAPAFAIEEVSAADGDAWQQMVTSLADERPEQADYEVWLGGEQREAVAAGRARWYVIRIAGRVIAQAGLFRNGPLARFANVATHPEARGRGYASALVRGILARAAAPHAVIVAEAGSQAERIYRREGFEPACLQRSIRVAPDGRG